MAIYRIELEHSADENTYHCAVLRGGEPVVFTGHKVRCEALKWAVAAIRTVRAHNLALYGEAF